uniref:Putative acyl-coa thioesterase n=2 Tax=Ornithodoros turicata TaxID=34597 RepID=A0A2R5LLE7_9ACAR
MPTQEELPPRSMRDSYDEVILPLASSVDFQKSHVGARGVVRYGKILEDMDVFGVWLSYRHLLYPGLSFGVPMPVSVVTALVDNIHGGHINLTMEHDLKLRGHVSWVGRTSIECSMELSQLEGDEQKKMLDAKFVMVAKKAGSADPAFVNKLKPHGPEEQAIFDRGVENIKRRKDFQDKSVMKVPPSDEERVILHNLFLEDFDPKTYILKSDECPKGAIFMDDAKLTNVIICQPESENLYNKVFGGFLMRSAFELAWATAYIMSGRRPWIYHTDDVWFRRPVDVGSLLHYEAQAVYTEDNLMQLNVNATVIHADKGTKEITNVFHFTFRLDGDEPAPRVIPRTYPETLHYIEGRRYMKLACIAAKENPLAGK